MTHNDDNINNGTMVPENAWKMPGQYCTLKYRTKTRQPSCHGRRFIC